CRRECQLCLPSGELLRPRNGLAYRGVYLWHACLLNVVMLGCGRCEVDSYGVLPRSRRLTEDAYGGSYLLLWAATGSRNFKTIGTLTTRKTRLHGELRRNDSQQLREDAGFNWERIEKLDRLARDVVVQETIIADMQRKRFEIRSVTEPDLCSDDPTRTLLRQMMGAFAEYERKMIVLKLRG